MTDAPTTRKQRTDQVREILKRAMAAAQESAEAAGYELGGLDGSYWYNEVEEKGEKSKAEARERQSQSVITQLQNLGIL
jgi:hypothetical protein